MLVGECIDKLVVQKRTNVFVSSGIRDFPYLSSSVSARLSCRLAMKAKVKASELELSRVCEFAARTRPVHLAHTERRIRAVGCSVAELVSGKAQQSAPAG